MIEFTPATAAGVFVALIAFSIAFNWKKLAAVYNNRKRIVERVIDSSDHERIFIGAMTFLLSLGFLLASL